MTENENENVYPKVEKQMSIVGVPFKVLSDEPKEIWMTNYAYYQKMLRDGGVVRPLFGRKQDGKFQVWDKDSGDWEDKDLWKDYSEEYEENGKKKKRLLFGNMFEVLVKFEGPTEISFYDKEQSASVTQPHEVCWVRFSKGLWQKIDKEKSHPRASKDDFYEIAYDKTKAPADMYTVTIKIPETPAE